MEILRLVLVLLHFIGMAGLIGGFLVLVLAPASAKHGAKAMLYGGLTQLVTGIALVLLSPANEFDHNKIGTKSAVTLAIVVCVTLAQRRKGSARVLFQHWVAEGHDRRNACHGTVRGSYLPSLIRSMWSPAGGSCHGSVARAWVRGGRRCG